MTIQEQWIEQAKAAIKQGQNENDFVAHCHPDNRSTARKAYRKALSVSIEHPTCTILYRPASREKQW